MTVKQKTSQPSVVAVDRTYQTTGKGASYLTLAYDRATSTDSPMLRALRTCAIFAADGASLQKNPHAPEVWADLFGRLGLLALGSSDQKLREPPASTAAKFADLWLPAPAATTGTGEVSWPLTLLVGSLAAATLPTLRQRYCTTLLSLTLKPGAGATVEGLVDLTVIDAGAAPGAGSAPGSITHTVERFSGTLDSERLKKKVWADLEKKYVTPENLSALHKAPNYRYYESR
ncbi:hypothetical protein AB0I35_30720 [Nocardia sp. NPDC050378]|uniref:hypothetical protein n=1 Tax=Nocardia sp. NPDC050378 TaxID=3155400 RepID=UPI0033C72687